MKKLGNYFGVSARELKKGQVHEIHQRNELRDVLNGISETIASIKENTAELTNYLNELGMLADIMGPDQKHKNDEKNMAEVLDGFVDYLKMKPESRSIEYMSKQEHEVKCCYRCGHVFTKGNICPKCGSRFEQ